MAFDLDADTQTVIADAVTKIGVRQNQYYNQQIGTDPDSGLPILRGRYWQGRLTPAAIPADGTAASPDLTLRVLPHPSWQTLGIALGAAAVALEVHEYDGATKGWVLIVHAMVNGHRWVWARNFVGGEDWRTHGWQRADEG